MEQIKFVIFILADYSDTQLYKQEDIPFFQFTLLKINTVLSSNSLLILFLIHSL